MELPFQIDKISNQVGFFKIGNCYGLHVTKPIELKVDDVEIESFENPLFTIYQVSANGVIQAYIVEPLYRYITMYANVLVMRRIKSVKSIKSDVAVRYTLGPLCVVTDEDSSVAIFCVDTSSRPVT